MLLRACENAWDFLVNAIHLRDPYIGTVQQHSNRVKYGKLSVHAPWDYMAISSEGDGLCIRL